MFHFRNETSNRIGVKLLSFQIIQQHKKFGHVYWASKHYKAYKTESVNCIFQRVSKPSACNPVRKKSYKSQSNHNKTAYLISNAVRELL